MTRIWYFSLAVWAFLAFHVPSLWLIYFLLVPKTGTGGLGDAIFNVFLILAWGVIHSILARGFTKKIIAGLVGEDFIKLVFVSMAGITQCLLLYLWRPLSGLYFHAQGVWYWILIGLFLVVNGGASVALLSMDYLESFGVRGIIRLMRGQPKQEIKLCLRGPYAYCRHPVYFSLIISMWVGPVMNCTKLEFSLLMSFYLLLGTYLEDRDTARQMGPAYKEYQRHVPILIPRLTPWRPF